MQRCQGTPSTCAIAFLRPWWASETHELDAGQAARAQAAQELAPERLGLGLADVDADHLAPARLVHAVGDHQRLLAHAAGLAHPLDLGVQPEVRVAALERPLAERRDLLVQRRGTAARPGPCSCPATPSCSTSRSTLRVETPLT